MFITIYGKTGATQKMHLKPKNSNTFQQGRSDTFKVHSNCVGPLKRIRIEHDNKGLAPGWFLERVSMLYKNMPMQYNAHFEKIRSDEKNLYIYAHRQKFSQ